MSKTDWTDPAAHERQQEEIRTLTEQLRAASETTQTQAEQLRVLEQGATELRELVETQKAEMTRLATEAAQRSAGGSDDEVARDFVAPVASVPRSEVSRGWATRDAGVMGAGDHVLRMYGSYDADGNWREGLMDSVPRNDWHAEAQLRAQELSIVRAACDAIRPHWRPERSVRRFLHHMQQGPESIARIFTDASGYGAEVLPDITLPQVERAAEMARGIEALFETMTLGPGGTKKLPFLNLDSAQMYIRSAPAGTDNDPATFKTSELGWDTRSFDPVTLAGVLLVDLDAEEDALIQWASVAAAQIVATRNAAVEDAILNGDTAATHQDTGLASWTAGGRWTAGSAKDHRKAWLGLRARAFDVSCTTDISSAATAKDYIKQLANMRAAHALGDVVLIPSPLHFLSNLLTDTDMWRTDGRGDMATNITGTLGTIAGRPVALSEFMSDELNASGLYDNSTKDYGGRLAVDRSRFRITRRRGLRMTMERYEHKGAGYLTITDRLSFATIDSSTTKNVHFGYKAPKS